VVIVTDRLYPAYCTVAGEQKMAKTHDPASFRQLGLLNAMGVMPTECDNLTMHQARSLIDEKMGAYTQVTTKNRAVFIH